MPVDLFGRPDTQSAQGSLGRPADDLTLREPIPRRPCRKPPLGQVPPSLDPRAARHHDPSLEPKEVEHLAHVAVVGPAGRAPTCRRAVLEVPHPQRPAPAKCGDDVPPKAEVLLDPFRRPSAVGSPIARVGPHHQAVDGVVLGQHDGGGVGPIIEQPPLLPPQPLEIVGRGHEVAAVYTRAPKPAGRGMAEQVTPVARQPSIAVAETL